MVEDDGQCSLMAAAQQPGRVPLACNTAVDPVHWESAAALLAPCALGPGRVAKQVVAGSGSSLGATCHIDCCGVQLALVMRRGGGVRPHP
jgi:hypothetical protein